MACKPSDGLNVRPLGIRRELPHLHVFQHALTKGGHGRLCEGPGGFQALAKKRMWGSATAADGKTRVTPGLRLHDVASVYREAV